MRISRLIIAVLLTFVGTLFCGALMTLPNVHASEHVHCETSTTDQQHRSQQEGLPCHTDNYDHHQLGSYTLQKNALSIGDSLEVATVTFHQTTIVNILRHNLARHQQKEGYELSRYHIRHIQTRKKE